MFFALFSLLGIRAFKNVDSTPFVFFTYLGGALFFGIIAIIVPNILEPLNRVWMILGKLLGRIVSPIVLGLLFFILITPSGIISRWIGRDELRLKRKNISSYWLDRIQPRPIKDSFKKQY